MLARPRGSDSAPTIVDDDQDTPPLFVDLGELAVLDVEHIVNVMELVVELLNALDAEASVGLGKLGGEVRHGGRERKRRGKSG